MTVAVATAEVGHVRTSHDQAHYWAIVLAGGDGERMRPAIESWLGFNCPKQYCTFVGSRSMLQHTLDRAGQLVHPKRIVTVVAREHRRFLGSFWQPDVAGRVIEQPRNRGTAPGIFLAVTYIMAADPQATVLMFPSDHFVFPEERFMAHVVRAGLLSRCLEGQFVLLGAQPDRPEREYGWIEPGAAKKAWTWSSHEEARGIRNFREKPSLSEARKLLELGCLWNTMITAVNVKTLWQLGNQLFPSMMDKFEALRQVLLAIQAGWMGEEQEQVTLSRIYQDMESADFSRDLLQSVPERAVVLPLRGVDWSDWGQPARVVESLARVGKRPYFCDSEHAFPRFSRGVGTVS